MNHRGGSGSVGPGVGRGGADSGVLVGKVLVFVSRANVLAPAMVCSVCSTTKLVGLFS